MAMCRITISELPGAGLLMEAGGDCTPGEGGLAEELMMVAIEAINKELDSRPDMSSPQLVGGHKESIRKVYGDEIAENFDKNSKPKPKPAPEIKPGTIFRRPS